MDAMFQNWLKMIDEYLVPFLRSKTGMWVIIGITFIFILY